MGVALSGDITIDTVVAQDCRPVGELMQAAGCKGNVLRELVGRPALEVPRGLFAALEERNRHLASTVLFVRALMDEFSEEPQVGTS